MLLGPANNVLFDETTPVLYWQASAGAWFGPYDNAYAIGRFHGLHQHLVGDPGRHRQILVNLVSNAVKFTHQGEGVVSVDSRGEATSSPLELHFAVRDTGIGIREADLPRLFDRFFRCDPSRSASGTGLGLSLAQAVAMAHGGEITVQSEPGQGSTFQVLLPRNGDKIDDSGSNRHT